MAILISAHQISKSYSSRPLFEKISFSISSGERIGLIGPNGAGKSTLLKILAGLTGIDSGQITQQKGLKIGYLSQVPEFKSEATVLSSLLEGAVDPDGWEAIALSQELMSKLELNEKNKISEDTKVSTLSGGWKKRVAIARELMKSPDIFLLDEPTNHLDVESILWLEEYLSESQIATLTITHDRVFLQRVSNKIMELNSRHKDGLISMTGDYAAFLEMREQLLAAQELEETKLRNTLRRETEWLRRGAIARLKKQQARINQAASLKDRVAALTQRNKSTFTKFDFVGMEKNAKKLIEAKDISKSYNGTTIVPKMSLVLTPKTRLGLIGPNGCGKSTLIKLLIGTETPDSGEIKQAEALQIAYFEQNRESLDQTLNLIKTVCPYGDHVDYAGTKVHVKSYLNRFNFSYDQMDMPVAKLSGGEQSRLLLARLMLRPMNVLVLDEPTNDLDMATLDTLEDVLRDFNGAIILVTHDRYFLDRVCNQLIAFGIDEKGKKELTTMVGIEQWEEWHELQIAIRKELEEGGLNTSGESKNAQEKTKKKLSYKEQREFETIENTIKLAEEKLAKLTQESQDPKTVTNATRLMELSQELAKAQAEVDHLYERWTYLSEFSES